MQRFNKATAAAIAGAVVTAVTAFWPGLETLDHELPAAITTVLTVILVYLVPNKESST